MVNVAKRGELAREQAADEKAADVSFVGQNPLPSTVEPNGSRSPLAIGPSAASASDVLLLPIAATFRIF